MTFILRQLIRVFLIRLRKSIQNIIIIRDYLQKNVSLSNSPELKKSFRREFVLLVLPR